MTLYNTSQYIHPPSQACTTPSSSPSPFQYIQASSYPHLCLHFWLDFLHDMTPTCK